MRTRISLPDISSFLFILLWCYTAFSKAIDFDITVSQLSKSPMVEQFAFILAILLPFTELALVVMLLLERTRMAALYASLALMVAFTTYLLILLNFSYYIPCSCGGILGNGIHWNGKVIFKLSWQGHVIFNLFFIAIGLLNVFLTSFRKEKFSLQQAKLEMA